MSIAHPVYRRGEQIADSCVHYAGLAASPIGAVVLVAVAAHRDNALAIVSVAIYAVGLLAMIASSAFYNLTVHPRRKEWLRRVDHAARGLGGPTFARPVRVRGPRRAVDGRAPIRPRHSGALQPLGHEL